MKNDYTVRAMKFIAAIAPYIGGCRETWDYRRAVAAFNSDYHRNVKVKSGATRVALITSDYVIKFNYGNRVRDFGGCGNEVRLYKQAEKDGYAYLLAKITAKIYDHKTYYIMPLVRGIGKHEDTDVWGFLKFDERDWLHAHGVFDLHEYNYGFKNGYPVIIDYAAQD